MVKNTVGGKKGKMMANKRSGGSSGGKLRLSECEEEIYVCVTKVCGGGVFMVVDNNKNEYQAFLRGKMKGPNKRHNFVSIFSILLVGIRLDSSEHNKCDILFVYDSNDIHYLSLLPHINLHHIIQLHQNQNIIPTGGNSADLLFSNNNTNTELVDKHHNTTSVETETEETAEFDFDDI
jgi:translation initiation factor IF-1